MSPFLGLARPRSFRLLHTLFRIYTENQPHRHLVAICQLQNYVRDLSRIAFRAPFEASQYLEHRTDRGLVVRQHIRRILTGTPCPVGSNTTRLERANLDAERRDFHRQRVAETAHRPRTPERCDRFSASASLVSRRALYTPRRKSRCPRPLGSPPHLSARTAQTAHNRHC